jgi:hypothetical protein
MIIPADALTQGNLRAHVHRITPLPTFFWTWAAEVATLRSSSPEGAARETGPGDSRETDSTRGLSAAAQAGAAEPIAVRRGP